MIEYVRQDAIIDAVYFYMEKVLLYWSVVQYNNVQEKDRIAQKGAMLPDGYITSILTFQTYPKNKKGILQQGNQGIWQENKLKVQRNHLGKQINGSLVSLA